MNEPQAPGKAHPAMAASATTRSGDWRAYTSNTRAAFAPAKARCTPSRRRSDSQNASAPIQLPAQLPIRPGTSAPK